VAFEDRSWKLCSMTRRGNFRRKALKNGGERECLAGVRKIIRGSKTPVNAQLHRQILQKKGIKVLSKNG